ncbi:MAG: hypothetical protein OXL96_28200 [Candidatus Poribacteria bacterium]|nr:hypothetical protein [Candidatus Poribacteria bacterium]
MAVRIRRFAHQNWVIGTPQRLNVRITGNPTRVLVEGIPDTYYYNWNATRNRVELRGTPEKVVYDAEMTITGDDVERIGTYSVIPVRPAFNQDITRTVFKGVPFSLPVEIENTAFMVEAADLSVQVDGPYIGLKPRNYKHGFDLYGTIDAAAQLTEDRFVFTPVVANYAGETRGTITIIPRDLSATRIYILDGNTVKVFQSVVPLTGVQQTVQKVKEFTLPSIPGSTANYVALANDGTNLYALHSAGPSASVDELDDQVVVVSPATANGRTAGIIRRFGINRHLNYYQHDIEDFYYWDGNLYILTSFVSSTEYNSYFVYYPVDNPSGLRIISLLEKGGGIAVVQERVTAVLYNRNSPSQGNRMEVYPPSYISGQTLIVESADRYRTFDVVSQASSLTTNKVSLANINNFAYILSSTFLDRVSVAELPTPIGNPIRRGHILLGESLTDPRGITAL